MDQRAFTIGIDYGTNSVRAIVVDTADGRVAGAHVFDYPSGEQGVLLDSKQPHLARQNPADYIEGLRVAVSGALTEAERDPAFRRDRVIGIGSDTTGSTPLPVDAQARPLALDPKWKANAAAHAWLWKDHTSAEKAAAITATARRHAPELLTPIGGTYSSEWWWSKIWHCRDVAPDVFDAAASWVELADFIPAVLSGVTDSREIVRCVCAAGHKAMYSPAWGGLPPKTFLARLDPKLADLRDRLYDEAHPPGRPAGRLSAEWAAALGLPAGIPIAMGGFDAHYGAVGSGVRTGTLVKIVGTSTCDCAIAPVSDDIGDVPGICGIVNGSILPDYFGIEAGQSAVGDILNWWVRLCQGDPSTGLGAGDLHERLSAAAATLAPGESGLIALDWNNGNRTVLVDPKLTGLLVGQTLHTTPAEVYRTLIESTAFGARVIIERLREYGIAIDRVVCCGGIAEKNDLFMQIYADVIGQPMLIAGSPQAPALGSAISAAVTAGAAAGGYDSWTEAQDRMTSLKQKRFEPRPNAKRTYDELFAIYRQLHDAFGLPAEALPKVGGGPGATSDLGTVMKRLLDIKAAATDASEHREQSSAAKRAAPFDGAQGVVSNVEPAKRRASDAVGESEGRSPSGHR